MAATVKFVEISQNEIKFEYKKIKFILEEQKVGVYGMGRCINLHQLDGVQKTFIKCIGWTRTDNHGGPGIECLTKSFTNMSASKQLALTYIKNLLS